MSCLIEDIQAEEMMNSLNQNLKNGCLPYFEKDAFQRMIVHLKIYHGPSAEIFEALMFTDQEFQMCFHAARARWDIDRCLSVRGLPSEILKVMLPFKEPELPSSSDVQDAISALISNKIDVRNKTMIWRVINAASITNRLVYDTLLKHLNTPGPVILQWEEVWERMYPGFKPPRFTVLNFQYMIFIKSMCDVCL